MPTCADGAESDHEALPLRRRHYARHNSIFELHGESDYSRRCSGGARLPPWPWSSVSHRAPPFMAKKKKLTSVKNAHHVHTADIDHNVVKAGGAHWEGLINICVKAAEEALDHPPSGYTVWQRNSLADTFVSMRATHRAIRVLLKLGDTHPESVDALVLARLQLEGLYNLCLMFEAPEYVTRFQHEAWMRQYTRWMLYRQELISIDRFRPEVDREHPRLMKLMQIWGITNEQRLTIEFREMELDPPAGFIPQPIKAFPTPGKVIEELPDGPKRRMLTRLYPEYQELCSYAHGRPVAGFGKMIFDDRSPTRRDFMKMYGEASVHEMFQKQILGAAQIYSLISVAQAAAELTKLCPLHLDLQSAATRAWNELHGAHFLVNAVWNIRTKELLGALG